jgi:hypothetical protein
MAMLPQLTWSVGVVGESVKSAIEDSSGMVSSSKFDVGEADLQGGLQGEGGSRRHGLCVCCWDGIDWV